MAGIRRVRVLRVVANARDQAACHRARMAAGPIAVAHVVSAAKRIRLAARREAGRGFLALGSAVANPLLAAFARLVLADDRGSEALAGNAAIIVGAVLFVIARGVLFFVRPAGLGD